MPRFANTTEVSVEKTKGEIEATVTRYGATGFMAGWEALAAMVAFKMRDRQLRFILPLPDRKATEFWRSPHRHKRRTDKAAFEAWEQACRQRWRALLLAIKAKLEAVECGISSFEEEFLAHLVLPGTGLTIGQTMMADLPEALRPGGKLPKLLPAAEAAPPWAQQPGEPDEAYAAFLIYLDLGPRRTLADVSAVVGPGAGLGATLAMAEAHRWRERAAECDKRGGE
jgi:hypothetical protein